jgi:hypothetical protein
MGYFDFAFGGGGGDGDAGFFTTRVAKFFTSRVERLRPFLRRLPLIPFCIGCGSLRFILITPIKSGGIAADVQSIINP